MAQECSSKRNAYILQKDHEYSTISSRMLKRIRLNNEFRYQTRNTTTREAAWEVAKDAVRRHLESGKPAQYRITYAHSIARMIAQCFVSRAQVVAATRKFDPDSVEARTAQAHRRQL